MYEGHLVILASIVSERFGADRVLLLGPTRAKAHVARARQVLMYLLHVSHQLPYGAIGKLLERDRTSVAYGVRRVEDIREDGSELDNWLDAMDNLIRGPQGPDT